MSNNPVVAAVKEAILPLPFAPNPIDGLLLAQVNVVFGTGLVKLTGIVFSPSQYSKSPGFEVLGIG